MNTTPSTTVPPPERLPILHHVKCWPDLFQATLDGMKTFEFRKNDRDYRTGDFIMLHEWSPRTEEYTDRKFSIRIGFMLTGMGVPEGWCVFAIHPAEIPARVVKTAMEAERER